MFLGAKRKEDLDLALDLLYPVLIEFGRTLNRRKQEARNSGLLRRSIHVRS